MTWEQTAEVLAKEVDRLQKENDRLRGGIQEGVKRLAYIPYYSALHLIFDSAKMVRNDLETLVSPAAEGGGAANGGESKIPTCPLCEKKMDARKVFNSEDNLNWVIGVCDSCNVHSPLLYQIDPQKALEAAIMGLHGMAKEFPNPMWKTREDYLAATISEINEILGK